MGYVVHMRSGLSFKSFLNIHGNAGDIVTISGPAFRTPATAIIGNDGYGQVAVKKKGTYTVTGGESNITSSVTVTQNSSVYNVDVSFAQTVNVKTNPGATITLTCTTYYVSGVANENGNITFVCKRYGTYDVTNSASGNYSTSPLSEQSVVCNTNGGTTNITNVKIHALDGISVGTYANQSAYGCYDISGQAASNFTGVRVLYKEGSVSTSASDGSAIGTGEGLDIRITNDTTKKGYTTPALTLGKTYYISIYPYVAIGGTNYFGISKSESWVCVSTSGKVAYSASNSWYVPNGARNITVFATGSGGGGGTGKYDTNQWFSGSGGGGGYVNKASWYGVVPGDKVSFSIGPGGNSVSGDSISGEDGSTTIVYLNDNEWFRAGGGIGGSKFNGAYSASSGGSGGSGGGCGCFVTSPNHYQFWGGNGGSNGASGDKAFGGATMEEYYGAPGSGQGASVVYFDGTYYSGGGGGCTSASNPGSKQGNDIRGRGGSWGGGNGAAIGTGQNVRQASAGITGSGGGGGGGYYDRSHPSGAGGYGTVVIMYS